MPAIASIRATCFVLTMFVSAGAAFAACVDGVNGPQRAPFEILKASILNADFEGAATQVDLGGNRENEVRVMLNRLAMQKLEPFTTCILLARRVHSPNYTTEYVYYARNGTQEYWLMVSGVQVKGETRLLDVHFSNSFSRFRDWLE